MAEVFSCRKHKKNVTSKLFSKKSSVYAEFSAPAPSFENTFHVLLSILDTIIAK